VHRTALHMTVAHGPISRVGASTKAPSSEAIELRHSMVRNKTPKLESLGVSACTNRTLVPISANPISIGVLLVSRGDRDHSAQVMAAVFRVRLGNTIEANQGDLRGGNG
jgi:hypothetical protein